MLLPWVGITRFESADGRHGDVKLYFRPMARDRDKQTDAGGAAGCRGMQLDGSAVVKSWTCTVQGPENGRELLRFSARSAPPFNSPQVSQTVSDGLVTVALHFRNVG
jgi:hypothetical protein